MKVVTIFLSMLALASGARKTIQEKIKEQRGELFNANGVSQPTFIESDKNQRFTLILLYSPLWMQFGTTMNAECPS